MSQYLELNDGRRMPTVGLGTFQETYGDEPQYQVNKSVVKAAVKSAVEVGYRHFDTASLYYTEESLGETLNDLISSKLISRDDVFVTTKLWSNCHRRKDVEAALRNSLAILNLDYVDMYLIHWPMALKSGSDLLPRDENGYLIFEETSISETWEGMIECQKLGLTKSIGVSNFCRRQLQTLIDCSSVTPANLQVEAHPFFSNSKLIEFSQRNGIQVTAYSPFGKPGRPWAKPEDPVVSTDPVLTAIGSKYNKTAVQVALRWQVQRGVAVIPKSNSPAHQRDNISIFDFSLSDDDVTEILTKCDCNFRAVKMQDVFDIGKDYPFDPFSDEY